ncbi:hypothetical protein [Spirosoma rigui]|uniref:hypothetical protein n=1 Tax=Spirosoma rigui TaxID=564064 RepID=UPI0009B130F7|nr:hypothetical protein [Spirosoma rigui]
MKYLFIPLLLLWLIPMAVGQTRFFRSLRPNQCPPDTSATAAWGQALEEKVIGGSLGMGVAMKAAALSRQCRQLGQDLVIITDAGDGMNRLNEMLRSISDDYNGQAFKPTIKKLVDIPPDQLRILTGRNVGYDDRKAPTDLAIAVEGMDRRIKQS